MSKVFYIKGDLFSAPPNSILVHACNTRGSWGAGIALAFRDRYPEQYEHYRAYCKAHGQALVGTCLLIPGAEHDIACLFTSLAYGKYKDSPAEILAATRTAVQDLIKYNVEGKTLHAWYAEIHVSLCITDKIGGLCTVASIQESLLFLGQTLKLF